MSDFVRLKTCKNTTTIHHLVVDTIDDYPKRYTCQIVKYLL